MEARVTAQSQGLKLRERMEEAKIQHGQEVRVDLPRIAVTAMAGGTAGEVFFCKLGAIRVREVRNPGNDRPLPNAGLAGSLRIVAVCIKLCTNTPRHITAAAG